MLSGAASLGCQILWAKSFSLGLGHEFPAVAAVVAAFFGGMALGACASGPLLRWLGGRAFAWLELIIGFWALLTPLLIDLANGWVTHWAGGFAAAFPVLLPGTLAMGASLPAMAALAATLQRPRRIAAAYAANTLGAVGGCLLTPFFLMPRFGIAHSILLCGSANLAVALAAFWLRRERPPAVPSLPLPGRLAATLCAAGFLALAFETVGVRLLSLSLENTIYSFAVILAVYLLGQALGAAWGSKFHAALPIAVACAASLWAFQFSGPLYGTLRGALGSSSAAVAWAEFLAAASVFFIPTLGMGALFGFLAERAGCPSLGRALAWNSLGAGLGAILAPAIIFPALGGYWTLALISAGYLALVPKWTRSTLGGAAIVALVLASGPRPLTLVRIPEGSVVREVREGAMATVTVAQSPDGQRTLFVNNRFQMGGTAAAIPELRHGHLPLLLHPNPRAALVLGVGTGITLSAAQFHPGLRADGVELLPEVIAVMPHFFPDAAESPLAAPAIRIHAFDARRFVRRTTNVYDVIIADLFHPAQDGAGFLYTVEHFERIRARLSDRGLFCQWLPLHQLDLNTFRDITATFLTAFPNAEAWLLRFNIDVPVVGLVGWIGVRPAIQPNWVEPRLDAALGPQLRRVALADSVRLFGCLMADSEQLWAFAAKGRVNTDQFPLVMFSAPAFSYRRGAPAHDSFMAFLGSLNSGPKLDLEDNPFSTRLRAFIHARDTYLRALVLEAGKKPDQALDGYVESARLSEDFTAGYAQGVTIAASQAKSNPAQARRILERLIEAQPKRTVAREMLDRLAP